VELVVLVADHVVPDSVESLGLALSSVDVPHPIVGEPVHEGVLHGGGDGGIGAVAVPAQVVLLLDVRVHTSADPHHPQELVDVVARVVAHTAEDHQHVVDVQPVADLIGFVLGGGHRQTHRRDVRVVPGVVVHQRRPVTEPCDLVPVIPPRHDDRLLGCVHPQPVVSLTIVVDHVSGPFVFARHHHRRRGVSLSSRHRSVADVSDQERRKNYENDGCNLYWQDLGTISSYPRKTWIQRRPSCP
jgi:hypothetical protein